VAAAERLGQAIRVLRGGAAYRAGLSGAQLSALEILERAPAARRRVSALAAELDLTQATVSEAVGALVRKGLATAVPAGGRSRRLDLTVAGRRVLEEAADWADPLAAAFGARSVEQQETTLAALLDVIADLQRAGVITVSRMCVTCRYFDRSGPVPRCALVDAPLPPAALRVDCPEHESVA
jgi:DNA-binding MarR family transcriptional regulator